MVASMQFCSCKKEANNFFQCVESTLIFFKRRNMKAILVIALVVCAIAAELCSKSNGLLLLLRQTNKFTAYAEDDLQAMFARFITKHKKNYGENLADYKQKYNIFKQNVAKAQRLNEENGSPAFGVTKFMDMSIEEFKKMYLSHPMNTPLAPRSNVTMFNDPIPAK